MFPLRNFPPTDPPCSLALNPHLFLEWSPLSCPGLSLLLQQLLNKMLLPLLSTQVSSVPCVSAPPSGMWAEMLCAACRTQRNLPCVLLLTPSLPAAWLLMQRLWGMAEPQMERSQVPERYPTKLTPPRLFTRASLPLCWALTCCVSLSHSSA